MNNDANYHPVVKTFYPRFDAPSSVASDAATHGKAHAERPMRHAFIVVGKQTLFMCHQIMLSMPEHNHESVFEITLPDDIRAAILKERTELGATHFLANSAGSERTLDKLASRNGQKVTADIWNFFPSPEDWGKEWPWAGAPNFQNVPVTIVRDVREIAIGDPVEQDFESYLLFGKGDEAHLYHLVRNRPDYDHVLSLRASPAEIPPDLLEAGCVISILDLPREKRFPPCSNPLPEGLYTASAVGIAQPFRIEVGRSFWFSTLVVNLPEVACPRGGDIPVLGSMPGDGDE